MELLVDPDFHLGATLCDEESAHCVKVLRHRVGDTVYVSDGNGTRFVCRLAKADARGCELEVLSVSRRELDKCRLTMAVAPTKNIDRFEWFVEKAVEIGIHKIIPMETERSERSRVRLDRLKRLVLAAAKQSLKDFLPEVVEITPFPNVVRDSAGQKFILHCADTPKPHLFSALKPAEDAVVMIGPEGDFSPAEVEAALRGGFCECTLGPERLRTETAAVVATNIVALRNQLA